MVSIKLPSIEKYARNYKDLLCMRDEENGNDDPRVLIVLYPFCCLELVFSSEWLSINSEIYICIGRYPRSSSNQHSCTL